MNDTQRDTRHKAQNDTPSHRVGTAEATGFGQILLVMD